MKFDLKADFEMSLGQKEAVSNLIKHYPASSKQTLLGITGSGKTFVMANMIQKVQKPTLIIAHNKTLAAQLFTELKDLFPNNRVEFFISYYDYYQPESYLPTTDTYIEKEATVNEQIEKFRLHAVSSLMSRNDVIVVASISCIYGLGNPNDFKAMSSTISVNLKMNRTEFIRNLISIQYERNDKSLESGKFRVRGDTIDLIPAYEDNIIRVEFEGNTIVKISEINSITMDKINDIDNITIFPARQYVVPEEKHKKAINSIQEELALELINLGPLEAERLRKRVKYDLEMIEEVGHCSGIENYSVHFDGRKSGEPPFVLLDYFPEDFFLIIDESHQTIPQSRAMFNGDHARKKSLIDYGFRLPSAFDNRPLKFAEFEKYFKHTLFVSATPGPYELEKSSNVAELIIRPTGLLDPIVEIKPIKNQISDLLLEISSVVKRNERILITTLTKRMAEDLTDHLAKENVKVRYLHSEIGNLERIELIRQLRAGEFDVLVGINLLREGLDLPEVSLICILDADKEGFLRDERSLIQTIGRAARNINGRVILYADIITKSIESTIAITNRRRRIQIEYNTKHKITPQTIIKKIADKKSEISSHKHLSKVDIEKKLIDLDTEMRKCAEKLDFEKAIQLRDAIKSLEREYASIQSDKNYKIKTAEIKREKNRNPKKINKTVK
ncbi:MAG: excinuclease ABC subunit UvrB [Candidatus Nanoarchaeia archaeon]